MGDQQAAVGERDRVEALAGQICARATQQAQATCRLIELIGEFDAAGGLGFLRGVKSLAHWLSYSCSMAPGVAREHVRVARALRQMPTITAAFRTGELSYSKVREATRLVGLVDEARLCRLARSASASQLARMISGYRTASGTRLAQQEQRRFGLVNRAKDQMTGLSGRLPVEEAGIVTAALQAARDRNQTVPPADPGGQQADPGQSDGPGSVEADQAGRATPPYTDADALLDICQHYLDTAARDDGSGEDRHLVVVEVAAEQLARQPAVPGQAPVASEAGTVVSEQLAESGSGDVPAGTSPEVKCTPQTSTEAVPIDPPNSERLSDADSVRATAGSPAWQPVRGSISIAAGRGSGSAATGHYPAPDGAAAAGGEATMRVSGQPGGVPAGTPHESNSHSVRDENGLDEPTSGLPARDGEAEVSVAAAPTTVAGTGSADRMVNGSRPGCGGVSEGTSGSLRSRVCCIRGQGGIEPATAARLSCTGSLLGAVVDAHGDVLALGRGRRLVSKTQRRALTIRDRMCQFAGCAQTRHLDAHHITPWSEGGHTDLDQLVLLCRFHHTVVHEGGIQIERAQTANSHNQEDVAAEAPASRWTFTLPDGEVLPAAGREVRTQHQLVRELTEQQAPDVDHIQGLGHPDSKVIRPEQTGERCDLHACVEALFHMTTPAVEQAA